MSIKKYITTKPLKALEFIDKASAKKLAFDVETLDTRYYNRLCHGGSYEKGKPTGISLCNGVWALYIDTCGWSLAEFSTVIDSLKKLLERTETIIAHNLPFDVNCLYKYGIELSQKKLFCTMTAAHLLDENRPKGLKYLAKEILGEAETLSWAESRKDKDLFQKYVLNDVIWTWELYWRFEQEMRHQKLLPLFEKIEMPFQRCLCEMERTGVLVDLDRVHRTSKELEQSLVEKEIEMLEFLEEPYELFENQDGPTQTNQPINFNSTQQLGEVLFDRLGLEVIETTRTGKRSTGKATLNAHKAHPFIQILLQYKTIKKLLSAFFEPLPALTDPDGRVRPNWRNTGTVTGRLSSARPNCLSLDTEVLTENRGWVRGYLIEEDEKIAIFDKDTETIRFEAPSSTYIGQSDDVWEITNSRLSIKATGDHRHLLRTRRALNWVVYEGEFPEDKMVYHAPPVANKTKEIGPLKQQLLVAIQADAHIRDAGIDFSFYKERKEDRLLDILNGLGIKYKNYSSGKRKRYYISLKDNNLSYLWEYLNKDTKTFYPSIIHSVGEVFCRELQYWDGSSTRKWGEWYCSTNSENVNIVQAVLVLNGYHANIGKDLRRIFVSENPYSYTTNRKIEKAPNQAVWCVKVSTGFFLARRNKQAWITGNCQQLPKKSNIFPIETRDCFIAPEGYKMVACDFSQQETRIMADLSQDENLLKILLEGGDIHLFSANNVFGLGIEEEKLFETHPEYSRIKAQYARERNQGKIFSFGIPYGMTEHKAAKDFGVSPEEGKRLMDNFFAGFPGLAKAIENTHKEAEKNLYVTTYAGRKRRFKHNQWGRLDNSALRQSFNFLIQSLGADLIRIAQNKLYDYAQTHPYMDIKQCMSVHDEVVFYVREEYADEVLGVVTQLFEDTWKLSVPLKAEAKAGNTYGEIK